MTEHYCPAMLLAAPASGQGKTTLTAGLARHHRNQGRAVQVFKTGPDFLDPMILEQASGRPVYPLDLWMMGEYECRRLLHTAAATADLILVEGVMGLYDGTPSSADLAETLNLPVLLSVDGAAMAQTFGAVVQGLIQWRPSLRFIGVLANRVGSPAHAQILAQALPDGVAWRGAVPKRAGLELPHRHLGLVQAREVADLEPRLEAAARAVATTAAVELPAAVGFAPTRSTAPPPLLRGLRIGVARDEAFAFVYRANLELLQAMGAKLRYFSPLRDGELPEVDSLYLPGGYPELHLQRLASTRPLLEALTAHAAQDRPIYAECGGMLYLLERLVDHDGQHATMASLLPGIAEMQPRLMALGFERVGFAHGELRGHTFHHSRLQTPLEPWCRGQRQRTGTLGEPVFRQRAITASYLHLYFPGNPHAAAALFTGRSPP